MVDLTASEIVTADAMREVRIPLPLAALLARRVSECGESCRGSRCGYSSKRRKIATAFWPPKPKPLIIAESTRFWRATCGV
jgi:hypothetical protein